MCYRPSGVFFAHVFVCSAFALCDAMAFPAASSTLAKNTQTSTRMIFIVRKIMLHS